MVRTSAASWEASPVSSRRPSRFQALGRRFEQGHLAARLTEQDDWIGLATRRELEALAEEAFAGVDDPALGELRRVTARLDHRTIYYLVAARSGRPRRPEGVS